MARLVFIFILFCTPFLGAAQVLENYAGDWTSSIEQTLLGAKGQKELKLPIHTFPQSFFRFEVPGNSTLFMDERLWGLIAVDTTFFIPSNVLAQDFGRDTVLVTVVTDKISTGNFTLSVTKVAKDRSSEEEKQVEGEDFIKPIYWVLSVLTYFNLVIIQTINNLYCNPLN